MCTGEHNRKGRLNHANSGGACWLYVRVLECQREDELEKRLSDVELERVLRRDQHKGLIEKERFPAIQDCANI